MKGNIGKALRRFIAFFELSLLIKETFNLSLWIINFDNAWIIQNDTYV
jgi:hypothetical protein